jgi:hypothetical protein
MQPPTPPNPNNNNNRKMQLEYPPSLNASYANTALISHSAYEFIMDFIQMMPPDGRARVQQRLIMTPTHAKLFLLALQENIDRYEAVNGVITVPPRPETLAEQLFRPQSKSDTDEKDKDTE